MNIRNLARSFGVTVGITASLLLSGGVMAEPVGTSITLADGEGCAASITGGTIDFGTFTWDAETATYTSADGPAQGDFTVSATSGSFSAAGGCSVTLEASGLKNSDDTVVMDDAVTLADDSQSGNPLTVLVQPGTPKTVTASLADGFVDTLSSYAPDEYSGDITVTSASASN